MGTTIEHFENGLLHILNRKPIMKEPKINTSKLLVIEVCRTAVAWTRVYKNQRAYNDKNMLLETASGSKSLSDRQLVRNTLKTMQEIALLMGPIKSDLKRDFVVLCIDDEDRARVMKMFA